MRRIEKNLKKALLEDGPLAQSLFEYELAEHIEEYIQSKQADNDKFFFAVTYHSDDVAMLLIDKNDKVHVNEDARNLLKKLWQDAYQENLQILIPDMARQLDAGYLYAAGVKLTTA